MAAAVPAGLERRLVGIAARTRGTELAAGRLGDIAVLLPARTSLVSSRRRSSGRVPYRAETSSLVYGTGEVRDLLMVLRPWRTPPTSWRWCAALRTPRFGCGDDDLYTWKVDHQGSWDHQAPLPEARRRPSGGEGLGAWALHACGCGCRPARCSTASCGTGGSSSSPSRTAAA